MLDFYLLDDAAPKPSPTRLEDLPKAGELSEGEFTFLQEHRIIESRLDYYQGFRWSSGVTQQKLQLLLQRFPQLSLTTVGQDAAAQRLYLVLLNASAANSGLVAVAD